MSRDPVCSPRSQTVLVAGAAGALGQQVARLAVGSGYDVRALVHRTSMSDPTGTMDIRKADARDATRLGEVCGGVDIVFSALGASVLPDFKRGRRSYFAVDTRANRNLIAAARAAGVKKFVYVSVACHQALGTLAYIRAHEQVVDTLAASGMPYLVIRPTGFYSAFASLLPMAMKGRVPIIGDGSAKTNPIDDAELASACIDAFDGDETEIELGGPEVLTRREIVDEAFRANGRPTKVVPLPAAVARLMGYAMWPISPRMAQLTQFIAAVSTTDVVAPARGSVRLAEYFASAAAAAQVH